MRASDLDLSGMPGLPAVLRQAENDPDSAYIQYIGLSKGVAALEKAHAVISNRYRPGCCDICLAPISWFGPQPSVGRGGRWVHGTFVVGDTSSQDTVGTPPLGAPSEPSGGHGHELDWYYASTAWTERKERYFSRHARLCAACGSTGTIHLHHTEYRNLGADSDEELVPLCRECHTECHVLQRQFGWDFYNMTSEYIRYRSHLIRRVELSRANDDLRLQQDRLRVHKNGRDDDEGRSVGT